MSLDLPLTDISLESHFDSINFMLYKQFMSLTKSDLEAIDTIVTKRVKPLEKKIDKVDKKVYKLFNFLDKDMSTMKEKVASRLGMDISEFSASKN